MFTTSPITAAGESDVAAIGASSATFSITLKPNERYRLAGNVGFWYVQAASPTALKNTAPSVYVAPGESATLSTAAPNITALKVAVIQDGSNVGFASIARCIVGR